MDSWSLPVLLVVEVFLWWVLYMLMIAIFLHLVPLQASLTKSLWLYNIISTFGKVASTLLADHFH